MKKYLLFFYMGWEPQGGWSDFIDSFDSIEGAKAAAKEEKDKDVSIGYYGQIVDSHNGSIVSFYSDDQIWCDK